MTPKAYQARIFSLVHAQMPMSLDLWAGLGPLLTHFARVRPGTVPDPTLGVAACFVVRLQVQAVQDLSGSHCLKRPQAAAWVCQTSLNDSRFPHFFTSLLVLFPQLSGKGLTGILHC